ncbi:MULTISPECIES: hypothetical protein [Brevundimonas]|uniref:Uncharacterized protein n=1 Tax=Brevundimonas nasdae TaxID=172043 RepID=A0A0B4CHD6_9CAUL|nr:MULTISPECIES: hypothetical protein [Brevundimonas]KIC55892.1 hypothetical protein RM53_14340 [Brevundimonas nasdae]RSB43079.1 hypothetical protein EGK63_12785 [Brevundimonas sp. 357]
MRGLDRSQRREVRNPVLGLPAARRLQALPPEVRADLRALFSDLAADARGRAQRSWSQNKGPMAAYWKATGAYAFHIARVLK